MQVIGVRRALRFSPNNEEKDLAILRAVVSPWDGEIIWKKTHRCPNYLPRPLSFLDGAHVVGPVLP